MKVEYPHARKNYANMQYLILIIIEMQRESSQNMQHLTYHLFVYLKKNPFCLLVVSLSLGGT